MISKSTFKEFSLEHSNGNYFLRPDRVLGCFYINQDKKPKLTLKLLGELQIERNREQQVIEKLKLTEDKHHLNTVRIDNTVSILWNSLKEVKIPTESNLDNVDMSHCIEMSKIHGDEEKQGRRDEQFQHNPMPDVGSIL